MKKIKLLILAFIAMALSFNPTSASFGDYGELFDVNLHVQEDGNIHIKTKASVMFSQSRQGIFVTVPTKYEDYKFEALTGNPKDNDKTIYFSLKNFKSTTHQFEESDSTSVGAVYRLGTKGQFLDGLNTFEYEYDLQTRDLDLSDESQMVFMNLIGDGWDYPFKKINFEITFDKPIDPNLVQFETSNKDRNIQFEATSNSIKGSYDQETGYKNALTLLVPLENDYFTFPNIDFTMIGAAISLVLVGLAVLLRIKYVEKQDVNVSVQFTAPPGLNSADVAYIYKDSLSSTDVVSLIMYWAEQGYLNIVEHDDKKIELIKIKDMYISNKEEVALFNDLFKNRDTVFIDDLKNSFYQSINRATLGMMKQFQKDPDRRIYNKKTSMVAVFTAFMSIVIAMLLGSLTLYSRFGVGDFAFAGAMGGFGVSIITLIILFVINIVQGKKPESITTYMIGLILVLAANGLVYAMIKQIGRTSFIYPEVMFFAYFITAVFATTSLQRTAQGAKWYGEVLGLKKFIETTEIERLKMFVEETPYLFYSVLPYAYVLGLSDLWAKKFETIAIEEPTWYRTNSMGTFNAYYLSRALSSSMNSVNTNLTSIPASAGTKGGGFSSGGGGGSFGGGGFGGGGGGSW